MNNIKKIISNIYDNEELRNSCIPLFLGNSGTGKTSIIKQFAKEKGVNCIDIIASQLMPHEISGLAMPLHETKQMTYFDYDMFCNLKDGDILFFDELLNANPMVLNACLTVLENRTLISGKKLPKVMIVAAANPQGATILTPQIKERFIWYNFKFDSETWKKYMSKYLITDNIFNQLCSFILNETFLNTSKNYYTPRSIEKAIKMLIADIPTPYRDTIKPILDELITNESENNIKIGDFEFKQGEKIKWLTLQQKIRNNENIRK